MAPFEARPLLRLTYSFTFTQSKLKLKLTINFRLGVAAPPAKYLV